MRNVLNYLEKKYMEEEDFYIFFFDVLKRECVWNERKGKVKIRVT